MLFVRFSYSRRQLARLHPLHDDEPRAVVAGPRHSPLGEPSLLHASRLVISQLADSSIFAWQAFFVTICGILAASASIPVYGLTNDAAYWSP